MKPEDLDAATKARIEAEEKYRAQVRVKLRRDAGAAIPSHSRVQKTPTAQPAPAPSAEDKKGPGCGTWTLYGLGLLLLIGIFQQCSGNSAPSTSSSPPSEPSESTRLSSFGYTCEELVKDNLKAPATAKVSNYYTDQREGRLTGTFASGYTWNSYVDSQNSFGANLRTRFACTTEPGSETVRMRFDQ
ncbi:hypothetical protein [Deinococcus arenicola]|uniref:Uncharacterized protein n=1 Tax=Deinococcus arenicola TaxID=2994950 RepID=A0ABU4DVH4_9DEIO|nr:hypothetical protein [Deinococcus sp. ZS9-10]MDV6376450.1 hypothetical protein [Deinococcus sp. ZS9-10]